MKRQKHQCEHCHEEYFDSSGLNKHIEEVHKLKPKSVRNTRQCPENACTFTCKASFQLADHLLADHDIKEAVSEKVKFESEIEFLCWKETLEEEAQSRFVQTTGKGKLKDSTTTYYSCYRSGNYVSKGTGIRRLKSIRSCKINNSCPAFLTVSQIGEIRSVTYCKYHYGHGIFDIQHRKLKTEEQKNLTFPLPQGHILDNIRIGVCHVESMKLNLSVTQLDENLWTIKSETSDDTYELEQWTTKVCCDVMCSDCRVCIHTYRCTCLDSLIKNTICTHVHVLASHLKQKLQDQVDRLYSDSLPSKCESEVQSPSELLPVPGEKGDSDISNELQTRLNNLSAQKVDESDIDLRSLKTDVESDLQFLLKVVPNLNDKSVLLDFREKLSSCITLVKTNDTLRNSLPNLTERPKVSENGTNELQTGFFPVTERNTENNNLNRPDKNILKSILEGEMVTVGSNKEMHTYSPKEQNVRTPLKRVLEMHTYSTKLRRLKKKPTS